MKNQIYEEISKTIEIVWKKDIRNDYNADRIVNEDTLKNAMYYHIRRRIGKLLEENSIRIYTEFNNDTFKQMKYRPDLVLAEMDFFQEAEYVIDQYKRCVAIIEIKLQGNTSSAPKLVYNDYKKLNKYAKKCGKKCLYYMATIWEAKDNPKTPWLDEDEWKKGNLTELNASYNRNKKIKFDVVKHKIV